MADFFGLLSFSVLPLVLVVSFSIVTPSMGAVMRIRNEIMLALALPSVANAGMVLGLLCGIDSEHEFALYGFATITTLLTVFVASRIGNGHGHREIYLAAMFVGGQILSSTFSALSPVAQTHVSHLLNGEILAAGGPETSLLAVICAVFLVLAMINRHSILAWCADSEFFRIGTKHHHILVFAMYISMAITITLGVATIGALLVTSLLVLPALFGDAGKGGIYQYLGFATGIGVIGSLAGFMVALIVDFPPAISAAAGIGVIGLCFRRFFPR